MTLRNLEIFLSVVAEGSMRQAAAKLYISQPTVSGAVAELEKECGAKLFERLGKKLYLLPKGRELADYAVKMLHLNDEIHRKVCNTDDTAPLRIGATLTVGTCVMTDILKELPGANPYVLVQNTHIIEEQLLMNHLDIALVEGIVENRELVTEPVIDDALVLIARSDDLLASQNTVAFSEVAKLPLIFREVGSGTREALESSILAFGDKPDIRWECNNTEGILNAVSAGLGYAVMSYRLISGRSGFSGITIDGVDFRRRFSLVHHKDKYLSDHIKSFMEICRNYRQ